MMRHRINLKKLNRKSSHRKALLINLSNSLIKHEIIKTALNFSKELRKFLEPIITISKVFVDKNIRFVFNKLRNIDSVLKLFKIISPRYINRNGGYLRIFKTGFRKGDNASLSYIKFI